MTPQELNRDIKRLLKAIVKRVEEKHETGCQIDIYREFYNEYKRLYYTDREFEDMNRQSIRIMVRLQIKYRFITHHHFGLHITVEGLA